MVSECSELLMCSNDLTHSGGIVICMNLFLVLFSPYIYNTSVRICLLYFGHFLDKCQMTLGQKCMEIMILWPFLDLIGQNGTIFREVWDFGWRSAVSLVVEMNNDGA